MDLLEYQAKELFRQVGIPVLPSQRIDHPTDLKRLEIPYPVVLKSQVPTGGRGRAGGIRAAYNTIDAIAAARVIFNLPIRGRYPKVLLAESRYDADQELYLAVVLDYAIGRPVLLGSAKGGIDADEATEHIHRVVVEQEFSPFYARRLTCKMGLESRLIESVSGIIQKMYLLFLQKDLDLVEINPLGISATGEVMALDGKIAVNDNALGRHAELMKLASTLVDYNTDSQGFSDRFTELNWTDTNGNIGIVCNDFCLAATTLDLVYRANGKPASCLIVGRYASWDSWSVSSPVQQLQSALEQLIETKTIRVILVNILSSPAAGEKVAEVIANYLLERAEKVPVLTASQRTERPNGSYSRTRHGSSNGNLSVHQRSTSVTQLPHFVIRVIGGNLNSLPERLAAMPVQWTDNLDEAVAGAIAIATAKVKQS